MAEFIKGCPEIQSLVVRVEGRAVEPQVVMRFFLVVAQAAHGFLLSLDQVLSASLRWVVAAAEVARSVVSDRDSRTSPC